jgi:hypothetical protein
VAGSILDRTEQSTRNKRSNVFPLRGCCLILYPIQCFCVRPEAGAQCGSSACLGSVRGVPRNRYTYRDLKSHICYTVFAIYHAPQSQNDRNEKSGHLCLTLVPIHPSIYIISLRARKRRTLLTSVALRYTFKS